MKYRIVKKTYNNGLSYYHIQERVLFFWIYLSKKLYGFNGNQRLSFSDLYSAKNYIFNIEFTEKKVIKKEIINND